MQANYLRKLQIARTTSMNNELCAHVAVISVHLPPSTEWIASYPVSRRSMEETLAYVVDSNILWRRFIGQSRDRKDAICSTIFFIHLMSY
jgi:hypothetical protein